VCASAFERCRLERLGDAAFRARASVEPVRGGVGKRARRFIQAVQSARAT